MMLRFPRFKAAIGAILLLVVGYLGSTLISPASAQDCCACAAAASEATIGAVNGFTGTAIAAQTATLTIGLANTAGEISKTIEGMGYVQGAMEDQKQIAATVRDQQGDRVKGAQTYQFSQSYCAAATQSAMNIAAAISNATPRASRSQAGVLGSSGFDVAGSGQPSVAQQVTSRFNERIKYFGHASDPATGGKAGTIPQGDRMVGAVLATRVLVTPQDKDMAAWVALNLISPYDVPAMTANQVADTAGKKRYLDRGGLETKIAMARDFTDDILITDRADTIDNHVYNANAQELGLPTVTRNVSLAEMRYLRDVNRFTPTYFQQIANLGEGGLLRELIALTAGELQQGNEANDIARRQLLVAATALAGKARGDLITMSSSATAQ
jgi:hypothetical protein